MRDLIAAYEAASKEVLTRAGWRKRTGGIYTLALEHPACFAWLGLNTATKHHPLRVNPVVGIRNEALDRVLRALLPPASGRRYITATLPVPVGYLTPANKCVTLDVVSVESARDAAVETERLARTYGLPLAERLAPLDALLEQFQQRTLPTVNRGEYEVPVLLGMVGRADEARQAVDALLRDTNRQDAVREQDEHFAAAMADWLELP